MKKTFAKKIGLIRKVLNFWLELPLPELLQQLLAEWKRQIVAARRRQDTAREVALNTARACIIELRKRLPGKCADCGVTTAPGTFRCQMHWHATRRRKLIPQPI